MNADKYLQHLDSIVGRDEDVIRRFDSDDGLPPVYTFVYKGWPRKEFITGFTFGLSAAEHPEWTEGRPELMISVESDDEAWPMSIGFIAAQARGKFAFHYGELVRFHAQVSPESTIEDYLIFFPPFLEREQAKVQLDEYLCFIYGMYPISKSEIEIYNSVGLKEFWHREAWDPLFVRR